MEGNSPHTDRSSHPDYALDVPHAPCFGSEKRSAVELVARKLNVKHSAARAWDDAVAEVNRTVQQRFTLPAASPHGQGGSAGTLADKPLTVTFNVPSKAIASLTQPVVDQIAAAILRTDGGATLCEVFGYATVENDT